MWFTFWRSGPTRTNLTPVVPVVSPQVAAAGHGGVGASSISPTGPNAPRKQPQAGAGGAAGDDVPSSLTLPGLVNAETQESPSRNDAAGLQLPRDDPLFPVLVRALQDMPPPETERVLAPARQLPRGPQANLRPLGRAVEDFDGLWRYVGGRVSLPVHYQRLIITGGKVIDRNESVSRIREEGDEVRWRGRLLLLLSCGDRMVIMDRGGRYVRYERA